MIVAPIPFQNPTIGTGLALGGAYMFNRDSGSDPSLIGVGGFKTDNGSFGYGLAFNYAWDDNRWTINSLVAQADVYYDLYLLGVPLPIEQSGQLARLSLQREFSKRFSLGAELSYLDSSVSGDIPLPPPLDLSQDLKLLRPALTFDYDTRDDTIYPTKGLHLAFSAQYGVKLDGPGEDYSKGVFLLDHFTPLGERATVASRFAACAASEAAPFYDKCFLGGTDAFPGFSSAQYLGQRLASAQVEYRQRISKRWGFVVFAGAGAVDDSFADLSDWKYAGGLGVRYRISKKFPLDYAVDVAVNDDSERTLYISAGQRF